MANMWWRLALAFLIPLPLLILGLLFIYGGALDMIARPDPDPYACFGSQRYEAQAKGRRTARCQGCGGRTDALADVR